MKLLVSVSPSFFFLDIPLTAHLSFSVGLFHLGLAAGNLRLMFGQFTIQKGNYITAPTPLSLRRVGDYAVNPIPVGVWRCEVMSDCDTAPCEPTHPSATPTPPSLRPTPPELAL